MIRFWIQYYYKWALDELPWKAHCTWQNSIFHIFLNISSQSGSGRTIHLEWWQHEWFPRWNMFKHNPPWSWYTFALCRIFCKQKWLEIKICTSSVRTPSTPREDPWGSANPALKSAAISHAPDLLPEDYDSFPTCNERMLLKQKYAFGIDLNHFSSFLIHYYSLQNWTNSRSDTTYRHPIKKWPVNTKNFTKALPRFKPETLFFSKMTEAILLIGW